jgi:hypothetical protein
MRGIIFLLCPETKVGGRGDPPVRATAFRELRNLLSYKLERAVAARHLDSYLHFDAGDLALVVQLHIIPIESSACREADIVIFDLAFGKAPVRSSFEISYRVRILS